ncbi:MAG: HAD-IC family P-type ATPase [Deltaproteobacteria bacterium]
MSIATFFATGSLAIAATVLIMSAPCAVLLAAPSAVFAGVRYGARRNIIIKGGIYLEGMGLVETIFFDKTGTLTEGKPKIVKILPLTERYSAEMLLSYAGSGEYYSQHPFARAIVEMASTSHIKINRLESFKVLPGKGVTAVFVDGSNIAVGGKSLLRELDVKSSPRLNTISNAMKGDGQSVVYVIKDGSAIGMIGLIDQPRGEAREAITALRHYGIKNIVMLTGDHLRVAEAVAGALGVDEVRSDLSPQEKLEYIKQYKLAHPGQVLAMVGEGLNDVPAMAFSDIAIAFGEHTNDPVLNEAGIVIVDNDIQRVADLVSLGQRTRRVIKQNYVVGVGVNIIGMFLGAAGMISPLIGLLFHEAATATVLLNSSRLLAQRKRDYSKKGT